MALTFTYGTKNRMLTDSSTTLKTKFNHHPNDTLHIENIFNNRANNRNLQFHNCYICELAQKRYKKKQNRYCHELSNAFN